MAELTYNAAYDTIEGDFPRSTDREAWVAIECDGVHWATVPADADGDAFTFSCSLAPVALARASLVVARATSGGFSRAATVVREPLRNGHGLLAANVFASDHHPLLALPWLELASGRLTLRGMHLPPEGDPKKLRVEFGPGVVYEVAYGGSAPEFGEHYWYWPNAAHSALAVTVDLGACARDADPFHFQLTYLNRGSLGGGTRPIDVWMPRDLKAFRDFPRDASQLDRVQGSSTAAISAVAGFNAYKTIEEIFSRAGLDFATRPAILDWGCGHGRVTGHFIDAWPDARICGTDIDSENIAWCCEHMGAERFTIAALWPPLSYTDATFDGVFGISVLTHLTAQAQAAWLGELARVLRPGGIALLTFQGAAHAAYTSRWRDAAWWETWSATEFDDERRPHLIATKIADADYYRSTTQSAASIVASCEVYFDVLWIEVAIFGGYQDCAVLRRRA